MILENKVGRVAVIQSVYHKDDKDWFERSVNSILAQTQVDVNLFLAVDGVVSKELKDKICAFEKDEARVKVFWFGESCGLACRLNALIDEVLKHDFEYIARMDSDDISFSDRFHKQIEFLRNNDDVDVCGTAVIEVNESEVKNCIKYVEVDHDILVRDIIKTCPFNHPTVMFRSHVFMSGLRYNSSLRNTQDYYLWVDLIKNGFMLGNVREPLLFFRVCRDFYKRRGISKVYNDVASRIYAMDMLNKHGVISYMHIFSLCILRLLPYPLNYWVYKNFRKTEKIDGEG